jgi:hypothetical protein
MTQRAIRTKRAALSIGERTEQLTRGRDGGDDAGALVDAVVDFGLALASDKVTNGLRNAGLGLPDGTVSAESIRASLSGKIGADVAELSPEGIAEALNVRLSNEVGRLLGVDGLDLLNGGDIAAQARALALQAVASGRPSTLVNAQLMRELRQSAAYMAAGIEPALRPDAANRARQRRHRRSYKQVWE